MSDHISPIRCYICLDSLSDDGAKRPVSLQCGHVYCHECVIRVANTDGRCSTCREGIIPDAIRLLYFDINPEYQQQITETLQIENNQLRTEAERLHRINNILIAPNTLPLISSLVAVEAHPFFIMRSPSRLQLQLLHGLQQIFSGFRIASGLGV